MNDSGGGKKKSDAIVVVVGGRKVATVTRNRSRWVSIGLWQTQFTRKKESGISLAFAKAYSARSIIFGPKPNVNERKKKILIRKLATFFLFVSHQAILFILFLSWSLRHSCPFRDVRHWRCAPHRRTALHFLRHINFNIYNDERKIAF